MTSFRLFAPALGILAAASPLNSCNDIDDGDTLWQTGAVVTVRPSADGSFVMQLDSATVLRPVNLCASPFGTKRVRALVSFAPAPGRCCTDTAAVYVYHMDSIRTKLPVASRGEADDSLYGCDPLDIVDDWVTVAEDGYLTLRIRMRDGMPGATHRVNLLTGLNPDNPFELELRHDAGGSTAGPVADALVAFDLNALAATEQQRAEVTLHWRSPRGRRSATFPLDLHRNGPADGCQ